MRLPVFIASLCALLSPLRAEWTIIMNDGRRYVPIEDVADFYKLSTPVVQGNRFRLSAPSRSIEGQVGGSEVLINGVKYALCFPITSKGGRTIVSAMDVTKIIEPVLRPQKIKNATAVRTIILDAGHGGHDSGATGPFGAEKDATLDVVLRAKKLLEADGYQVRLTRMTDTFVPLENRAEMANKHANAIFVSVHFNKSSNGGGASGVETYCLAPRGVPSMDEASLRYSDFVEHPGHARDAENVALATTVHAAMIRNLHPVDRGIKRARFVVIKNVCIPGILVEGGFIDNGLEARRIATPAYRQAIAQSVVDGVNRYRNAVAGQYQYQKPSAIISATDPTTVPSLNKPAASVGSKTSDTQAVAEVKNAIESVPKGN